MAALVVGVPKEIKDNENRVAMQPDGVAELVHHGHAVLVAGRCRGRFPVLRRGIRGGRRDHRAYRGRRCSPAPT